MKLMFTSVAAITVSVSYVIAGGPIEGCLKTHTGKRVNHHKTPC